MTFKLFASIALAASIAAPATAHSTGAQAAAEGPVTVPTATLLSYAGTYRTDRGMAAAIALGLDGSLSIELNGPPLRMRAVSQTEFAVDEKRARITFNANKGKVSGLTIRMGSRELHASRVD